MTTVSMLAAASAAELPPQLGGLWRAEGADRCRRLESALGGPDRACRVTGRRDFGPSRWYVDFDCGGARLALDVNLLAGDRLLVAERPLGEAHVRVRCGAPASPERESGR